MNRFGVVLKNVYMKNIKSMGFWLMLLSPIIFVGIVFGIGYLMSNKDEAPVVAVVTNDSYYQVVTEQLPKEQIKVKKGVHTLAEAKKLMKNEKIDGYVLLKDTPENLTIYYFNRDNSDRGISEEDLTALFQPLKLRNTAQRLKLSDTDLVQLAANVAVKKDIVTYDNGKEKIKTDDSKEAQKLVSYAFTIIMFIFIFYYAQIIAQEVAAEKGSRIMEILLSSSSAASQFFGKITAILLIGLTQISVYALSGVIGYFALKDKAFVKELIGTIDFQEIVTQIFGFGFLLFILSVVLYAVTAAILGSLVSKMEEVGQAIMPLSLLLMLGYFIGLTVNANPNQMFIKFGSYFPFFAGMIMPGRYMNGVVSAGNVWISALIMVITIIVLLYFGAKIYRANVLVYSDKGLIAAIKKSFSLMKSERA